MNVHPLLLIAGTYYYDVRSVRIVGSDAGADTVTDIGLDNVPVYR